MSAISTSFSFHGSSRTQHRAKRALRLRIAVGLAVALIGLAMTAVGTRMTGPSAGMQTDGSWLDFEASPPGHPEITPTWPLFPSYPWH
jgi:hypothetical protein